MLKRLAQVGFVSAAVLSASVGVAEQKVPFKNIVALAQSNDLFNSEIGFYYVLDSEQNLIWLLNEEGYFEGLIAFLEYDDAFHAIRNGRTEFEFSANVPVSATLFDGFKEEYLPATRAQFTRIAGSKLIEPLGDFLPEGTLFTSLFTVETPDGSYLTWAPDYLARGIYVENFDTGDISFVSMNDLASALNLSRGESGNE